MRALAPEGVLSVGADLVIATDKAGPADVVRALKAATPYVEVAEGNSADGVAAKIRTVARAIGKEADGEALAAQVTIDLAAVAAERQSVVKPLRALFVLNVVSGRATVGGAGTNADAMLRLAGLANAAGALQGFKPVGDEALIEMRPDIVITMKPVTGSGLDTRQLWSLPGLVNSSAGAAHRAIEMDGLYLLGFGPRVAAAARDLMRAAYVSGSIPPAR
jgi:iron complex transport system substrate-binding protein